MSKAKRSLLYWLVLSPILIAILFPYAVMLSTALKPRSEIFVFDPTWWPSELRWSNFSDMWHAMDFGKALVNSLERGVGPVLLQPIPVAPWLLWLVGGGVVLIAGLLLLYIVRG